jgi:hypothetical protein
MDPRDEIIQIFRTFFEAQEKLKRLAPEYKWTGMGNLLGDFGEFMAIEHYDLLKSPGGSDGFDAKTKEGKTVQFKANYSAKQVGIRGQADLLLVLSISSDASFEEIYFGSFDFAKEHANYSSRDNKWMVGIQKLKKLNLEK